MSRKGEFTSFLDNLLIIILLREYKMKEYFGFLSTGEIKKTSQIEFCAFIFVLSFFTKLICVIFDRNWSYAYSHPFIKSFGCAMFFCLLAWSISLGRNKNQNYLRTFLFSFLIHIIYLILSFGKVWDRYDLMFFIFLNSVSCITITFTHWIFTKNKEFIRSKFEIFIKFMDKLL